jgi:Protein of unknown function DUF86
MSLMRGRRGNGSHRTRCCSMPRSTHSNVSVRRRIEYRETHAEIPWEKIAAFRHRLVHDYPRIELPKVWAVVENHLGPLISALEPLVPPAEAASGE